MGGAIGNIAGRPDDLTGEIGDFVHQKSRLTFSGNRRSILVRRVAERMESLAFEDMRGYFDLLRSSREEEEILLDLLTTNETYFFRIEEQFRYLKEEIIPAIQEDRNRRVMRSWGAGADIPASQIMRIRILCAGCSTGEEPYSVAMTLHEALRFPRAWNVEILAGDISPTCLATAERGIYGREQMKGVPPAFIERYFAPAPGGYAVSADIRRMVRFSRLNLADIIAGEPYPGMDACFPGFDIIFCRNVMIYFSSSAQQELVDALHRSLSPGGWLFSGDGEPLHLFRHEFVAAAHEAPLIYRKPCEKT